MKLTDDMCSITELKRHTKEVLDQVRQTRRPVMLTVNGRADAVLIDANQSPPREGINILD